MPITRHQLEAATEALRLALKFARPADSVLREFFRAHRALNAHDRAFVADAVYGVLRRKRTVDRLAPGGAPRPLLLAWLARVAGISVRELSALLTEDESAWLARVKAASLDELPLAVRAELPDWIVDRLGAALSETEILALARGLNEPAPLDLRVNTWRAKRDEVLRELAAGRVAAAPTPYSPVGVRVKARPAINRHLLFTSGAVEVQDEASQLMGFLVAPRRHDLVVDFCAGAGGKSLMLGALMQSHGRVYAFDVSTARLARLKPRLKRSGLSNLYVQAIRNENDVRVKRLAGKIDRVLVDAPCSGLGTLRRNPDLKWRQSPQSVEELKLKQAAILRSAANLVKPGGRLVYATCSILPEENQDIVTRFLEEHGEFRRLGCNQVLAQQRIALDTGTYLELRPHLHGTDGFFAAALERR
ncbi:MAG: RsmB/NOP family class I SAM-dependent RNA methyltransferase [Betaproteobacteria bacterium]|nr:RsmB/NOP family class I SAM-dependent RNA methyltransferase [Betaproteobacteria bacterium]